MAKEEELNERRLEALRHALGPKILKALDDPDVVEIMLNDDGSFWIESLGMMTCIGEISVNDGIAILNQVSSSLNGEISKENPIVEGELPLNGERFEGVAPIGGVVERPIFSIRKKAGRIFTLEDYTRANVLSFLQAERLRSAIVERQNILVVGGAGSGKTTFANALLQELAILCPNIRMLILEDTRELQCALSNRVFMRTTTWISMARLAIVVNRLRPDSVSVGEVRAGDAALALLKLWNTGHPGGVATVHANSTYKGLTRMDQLIQEVSVNAQRNLIAEAVNIVVFLKRTKNGRKVEEIVTVNGYDAIEQKFIVSAVK